MLKTVNTTHCAIIIVLFAVFQACNHKSQKTQQSALYQYEYNFTDTTELGNTLVFTNTSDSCIQISFSVNQKFWFNNYDLQKYIQSVQVDSIRNVEHKITQAFMFVCCYSKHFNPLELKENWVTYPLLLFNSIGSGMCDDRSAALAEIWQSMGYKSRVFHLGGHAVAEVFSGGKWMMFDADNGICFFDIKGEVASVSQIASQSIQREPKIVEPNVTTVELYFLLNLDYYMKLFTSTDNNQAQYPEPSGFPKYRQELSLAPHSSIEFPAETNKIKGENHYQYCSITIPDGFSGMLNFPLVIHHTEGTGIMLSQHAVIVPGLERLAFPPGNYFVQSSGMTVYAYINPMLLQFNNNINIAITSNNAVKPKVDLVYTAINESKANASLVSDVNYNTIVPYFQFFNNNPSFAKNDSIQSFAQLKELCIQVHSEIYGKKPDFALLDLKINAIENKLTQSGISDEVFFNQINNVAILKVFVVSLLEYNQNTILLMLTSLNPD